MKVTFSHLRAQRNNTSNNRQGRPRQRPSILKRSTFQGLNNTQVMLDLILYQTLEIIQDSDLSKVLDQTQIWKIQPAT